jgi:segregation and condensation protein B
MRWRFVDDVECGSLSKSKAFTPDIESDGDYSTGVPKHAASAHGTNLAARIEAILHVSSSPVTIRELADALQVPSLKIEGALETLAKEYEQRGIRLQHHKSAFQLTTAPEIAADVERFLNLDSTAYLTRAALEVLSIIAYQQPVTRPQIDSIRGVNSDSVLRTLLRHGLIEEVGRSDGPGRPFLYATTSEFLQYFGINDISELPPLSLDSIPEVEGTAGEDLETPGKRSKD